VTGDHQINKAHDHSAASSKKVNFAAVDQKEKTLKAGSGNITAQYIARERKLMINLVIAR
jgi:hypothetical protein